MDPSQMSNTQLPNTSISGSPFMSNKDVKLRKKRTQSKLTFLKNPPTKKVRNDASERVNNCEELESAEEGRDKFTLLTNEIQTSSDNIVSEDNGKSNEKQNIVMDVCPVCLKTFESKDKVLHMKTCAAKHNLTLKQLLNAVDLQSKQVEERRNLGLPCVPAITSVKKVSTRKNSSTTDKNDPDLQLGLALSVSMRENEEQKLLIEQEIMLEAGLGDEVAANQASLLEKYGFTSSKPVLPSIYSRSKQGKHKWKSVPLLLSRSQEERERLITEKVAIILTNEGGNEPQFPLHDAENEFHIVDTLQSGVLHELQNKECYLWRKASSSPCSNIDSYYVQPLGHIISPSKIKTSYKVLDLSQVPCRLNLPPSSSLKDLDSSITPISGDTVPIRCDSLEMQTVLESKPLLESRINNDGELLDLHEVTSQLQSPDERIPGPSRSLNSNITPVTESKVPVRRSYIYAKHFHGKNNAIESNFPEKIERNISFLETLSRNWMILLNKQFMSDILIHVKGDLIIYAHELVLFARCPNMLFSVKEEKPLKYIDWKEISFKSALAFLYYIYAGSVRRIDELVENIDEIVYLSQLYVCAELSSYLNCCIFLCSVRDCCNSDIGSNCRTKWKGKVRVSQADIVTLVPSSRCMTKSCEELEREKECMYFNVDDGQDRKDNSSVCMDSSWKSDTNHKSSNSPDPFEDIYEPEVISVQSDQMNSISNTQRDIQYLLETLALQPQSCVAQKEFNGEKSVSSADNRMHVISSNEKRNVLNSVSTVKEMTTSRGAYTEREKSIISVRTPEEINMGTETCNGNETKYNVDNCFSEEKLNIEDIVVLEHITLNKCDSPSNKRRRSSTSNTSKTTQTWNNERPLTQIILDKCCDKDDIQPYEEIDINRSFSQNNSANHSKRNIKTIRRLLSSNTLCDVKELPCSQIKMKNMEKENDTSHSASIQNTLSHSSDKNLVDSCNSDIFNFCTESDLTKLNAIGSRCSSSPDHVNKDETECGKIVKNVEEKYKFSSLNLSRGDSPLLNQSKSYTQTFDLPRTRSTSDISIIGDSSSPISVKCLSQTSIHLKSSCNVTDQNIVLPAHDIESAAFNSNIYARESVTSPAASSTHAVKTPNSSLYSIKRLLENSFASEFDTNFMEEISDDFKNVPCSTPVDLVPRRLARNKELQSGGHCVTPIADYSGMNTPALKKELHKYGLKPLKRPKAKQILRHIYDELHPLVPADCKSSTKSSEDNMFCTISPRKKSSVNPCHIISPIKQCTSERSPTKEAESLGNDLNESIHSTQGSSSSPCEFEDPEDSSEDTSETDKNEFRSIVCNYIAKDIKMYEQMLLYKPILVEHLQDALKAENHKFKLSHLMQVLDEECITYQSMQAAKTRQRKKKSRKGV